MKIHIKSEDKKNIIIICLCIVVLLMVTGFSSFAQYTATHTELVQKGHIGSNWNIGFDSTRVISEDGGTVGISKYSHTMISFSNKITQPGGKVAVEITIKNYGMLDAKVSNISMTPSFTDSTDVLMKSLDGIAVGDVIKSGETKKVVYSVKHNPNATNTKKNIFNTKLFIGFVQA